MRPLLRLSSFLLAVSLPASAALTGSGSLTFVPGTGNDGPAAPGIPNSYFNITGTGFNSEFVTAPAPWAGTIIGVGDVPDTFGTGTTTFNFSGLTLGFLPAGSYLRLSDVDSSEGVTITAFDQNGDPIDNWLNDDAFVSGVNSAQFFAHFLPAYSSLAGTYTFTGETASGNPTLLVSLSTNQPIYRLALTKDESYGIGLAASSVPEPGTYALVGLGLTAIGALKRRRS
jgi:hypothetical protein